MKKPTKQFLSFFGLLLLAGCSKSSTPPVEGIGVAPLRPGQMALKADERLITILATNDIHGGVESKLNRSGHESGGLAIFSGIVKSIRQGLRNDYGDRAGVLVLDGGDQFQGTLLSNFSEGELVYKAMSEIGYDAVVPGNHAYDFGPQGWLEDQVTPTSADQNPRGSLLKIAAQAKFPLVSANTYLKSSIVDANGGTFRVEGGRCKVNSTVRKVDWSKAKRPSYLKPYVIKEVAGLQVALIGIDHPTTPSMTTLANVSDFCFRDEADTYSEVVAEIGDRAQVFVIVMHSGDSGTGSEGTDLIKKLAASRTRVDAIVAGHTHFVNNVNVEKVPLIQSSANGEKFGRIDLVFNLAAGKVDVQKTRQAAGIPIWKTGCPRDASAYCASDEVTGFVSYEGVQMTPDPAIAEMVVEARKQIAPIAGRVLGKTTGVMKVHRIKESNLANALTDTLRTVSGADLAFMNAGGIRAPLEQGDFTYEDFYRVIPFNNRGVKIGPMTAESVVKLLERSVKTCGLYGALMQSGLLVEFDRDCRAPVNELDPAAHLTKVTTLSGETILSLVNGKRVLSSRTFQVATLDFLHAGGSGFEDFVGAPLVEDLGLAREVMVDYFLRSPVVYSADTDGRWKESLRAQ
jgi:5'-nucleotidase